jgi:tetratricopeptide (TPR) repeat protein
MGHRGSHLIGNRSEIGRCAARLSLRSSAVLLSVGRRGDPEQGSCSDGMPEEHTTERARLAGVSIIARNSGFTDKGKPVKPGQVNRVLRVRVTPEEAEHRGGPSMNAGAEEKLKEGIKFYRYYTKGDNEKARALFREVLKATEPHPEATEPNPQLAARACAGLAATYRQDWNFEWTPDDPDKLSDIERQALLRGKEQVAIELAQHSVVLDPSSLDGHVQLAYLYLYKMDHDQAEQEARAVIRLGGDSFAEGYAVWAQVLTYGGEPEVAVLLMKQALELVAPEKPVSYLRQLGQAYYVMGQVQKYQKRDALKAQEYYEKAKEPLIEASNRNHRQARLTLAAVYTESNDRSDIVQAQGLFVEDPGMRRHITIGQYRQQAPYKDQAQAMDTGEPSMKQRYIAALRRAESFGETHEPGHGPP